MKPHVTILGAGPAGLGAAYKLAASGKARVTVLERNAQVGGNAGSLELGGMCVDYGSHRLHPASDPVVLNDLRSLLGGDLLDRPRHGRIRLRGRWIHFPLKPVDLALRLPPNFALGVVGDLARKTFGLNRTDAPESFATVLEAGLGSTICRDFYFPYARKVWGADPEQLAVTQAKRRVSANSLGKMIRKVLSAAPGGKTQGKGHFYYPRHGFGQISEAYHRAAVEAGAEVRLNTAVQGVEVQEGAARAVRFASAGETKTLETDYVWSTLPITLLVKGLSPAAPADLLQAAASMEYRAMILIYLVLEQDRFSEYDAHYFPETSIRISRLSEPKNYSLEGPRGVTVLCAELPCSPQDDVWGQSDEALGALVRDNLAAAGIPVTARVREVATRRLRQAYPIYKQGYEPYFQRLDEYVEGIDRLLTFGRQGLFAHDNTHHALYMAYAAADCIGSDGQFDKNNWAAYRRVFETHVVED